MSEEIIEQTFAVEDTAQVSIGNICGSVEVRPGEEGVVSIRAVKHTETGDAKRTRVEIVQGAGGKVRARVRFREGFVFLWGWGKKEPCQVDFIVRVPRSCKLEVDCISSEAAIEGLEGEFAVKMVSGSLEIHQLRGQVRIRTVSGDVTGGGVRGTMDVSTVSGDVELTACELSALKAGSVSGDLTLESTLGEGPYQFKSVSGDVCLQLPPDSRATVEVSSLSGDVLVTHPAGEARSEQLGKGKRRIQLNGGGTPLRFSSVSGNLRIAGAGELMASAVTEMEGPPAEPAMDILSILERIERGELSVEEGIAAIEGS